MYFKSIHLVMSTIQYYHCKGAFLCIVLFKYMTNKKPLELTYAVIFNYFTKLYNQMRQMTSVIFS